MTSQPQSNAGSGSGDVFDFIDEADTIQVFPRPPEEQSLAQDAVFGAAQGLGDLTSIVGLGEAAIQAPLTFGLLDSEQRRKVSTPGQDARTQQLLDPNLSDLDFIALAGDDDLIGPDRLPGQRIATRDAIEEIGDGNTRQESIRRVVRSVASLPAGGKVAAGAAIRDLFGLAAKKTSEKLGAGEGVQNIVDLLASVTPVPSKFKPSGRKLPISGKGAATNQEELYQFGRSLGLSDAELVPLMQDGTTQEILGRIVQGSRSAQKKLDSAGRAAGRIFDHLGAQENALKLLSPQQQATFVQELQQAGQKLSADARKLIAADVDLFTRRPLTGESIMRFWADINKKITKEAKIGLLKEPLLNALQSLDPSLARDFQLANTLFSNYAKLNKLMKPTKITQYFLAGERVGALGAALMGNFMPLVGALGIEGGRKVAEQLLLNPKFQNLSKQLITNLNNNKLSAAKKVLDSMAGMSDEISPEFAAQLREVSEDQLDELFNPVQ